MCVDRFSNDAADEGREQVRGSVDEACIDNPLLATHKIAGNLILTNEPIIRVSMVRQTELLGPEQVGSVRSCLVPSLNKSRGGACNKRYIQVSGLSKEMVLFPDKSMLLFGVQLNWEMTPVDIAASNLFVKVGISCHDSASPYVFKVVLELHDPSKVFNVVIELP